MDAETTDVLSGYPVQRHRFTLDDYHRLIEVGILGEDDRIELLEGQLVDMPSVGPRHALAVDALMDWLVPATAGRASVRVQNPITLVPASEPEPDIVLVRKPWRGYPKQHPAAEDIVLVVEVADSSRDIDFGAKRVIYARAKIRELWLVDLTADSVSVCRDPDGDRYRSVLSVVAPGVLEIEALPDVSIPAAALFF